MASIIGTIPIDTVVFGGPLFPFTTGLSPPNRRNARWALGLAGAMAFFLAEAAGGEWVRADPLNSGVIGAWLPMAVPLVELGFLVVLARRRKDLRGWRVQAMNCPDIHRLIDLYHGHRDPALEKHVRTCSSCQADLEILFLIPVAFAADMEVPNALVERVLANLPAAEGEPGAGNFALGPGLASGLLGSLTVIFGLSVTGSAGAGPPIMFLLLSLFVGGAVLMLQNRLDRWATAFDPDGPS